MTFHLTDEDEELEKDPLCTCSPVPYVHSMVQSSKIKWKWVIRELRNLKGALSINALRACAYIGGHFRMIRKWRTLSSFLFCSFSREIGINSEKCIEHGK